MISKRSLSWASRDRSVEDPGLPASPIWWNGRKGMRHEEAKGGQEGDQTLRLIFLRSWSEVERGEGPCT